MDIPEGFSLYYLAYDGPASNHHGRHWTDREGIIELNHTPGRENDPDYLMSTGNTEPYLGFAHVAISVDSIAAACQRLQDAGHSIQKKPTFAIVKDPDGYWVELLEIQGSTIDKVSTDLSCYKQNHCTIRIKSPEPSLKFYQEIMGMTLVHTVEPPSAEFTLYFLAYTGANPPLNKNAPDYPIAEWEGVVSLMWNHGSEKQQGKLYHDGNSDPFGFGHFCKLKVLSFGSFFSISCSI